MTRFAAFREARLETLTMQQLSEVVIENALQIEELKEENSKIKRLAYGTEKLAHKLCAADFKLKQRGEDDTQTLYRIIRDLQSRVKQIEQRAGR